ncbi:MAG: tripartite tricarboxylate transporter permease [Pigmentiphaga sp.]
MDLFEVLATVTSFDVALTVLLCTLYGSIVGAMPGLSASMAVALLVPFTYFMSPLLACAAIVSTTLATVFAGDISSTLLRIPGTPASAAYVDDAHGLALKGKARTALFISLFCSVIGGLIGVAALVFASTSLARFAADFSSVESFWLASLGLTCAVFVGGPSAARNLASLMIGLAIATIGIDVGVGYPRFTFGNLDLLDGVSFICAMIGLFAVTELFRSAGGKKNPVLTGAKLESMWQAARNAWKELRTRKVAILRSGGIGTLIGVIPGAGADVAAWIAYGVSRKTSRNPELYGTGTPDGIISPSSANNAAVAGSWTPALVFGIPGDSITAIAVGVLLMKGLNPGPQIFSGDLTLVYAIFGSFALANVILLFSGAFAIYAGSSILRVPQSILMTSVMMLSVVGAYAVVQSVHGVWVVAAMGLVGFLLIKASIPLAPAILGLVLGRVLEDNFMLSIMKSQGDLGYFFSRNIAAVLGGMTLLLWGLLIYGAVRRVMRSRQLSKT